MAEEMQGASSVAYPSNHARAERPVGSGAGAITIHDSEGDLEVITTYDSDHDSDPEEDSIIVDVSQSEGQSSGQLSSDAQ